MLVCLVFGWPSCPGLCVPHGCFALLHVWLAPDAGWAQGESKTGSNDHERTQSFYRVRTADADEVKEFGVITTESLLGSALRMRMKFQEFGVTKYPYR